MKFKFPLKFGKKWVPPENLIPSLPPYDYPFRVYLTYTVNIILGSPENLKVTYTCTMYTRVCTSLIPNHTSFDRSNYALPW